MTKKFTLYFLITFLSLFLHSGCRGPEAFLGSPSPMELSDDQVAQYEEFFKDMTLVDTEGEIYDTETLHTSITVLNFWASWCPPCRWEFPSLVDLQELYSPDQLLVIGINNDNETMDIINETRDEFGLNFPLVSEDGPFIGDHFDIETIPRTFIFYKGRFVEAHRGATDFTHPSMIEMITNLLTGEEENRE